MITFALAFFLASISVATEKFAVKAYVDFAEKRDIHLQDLIDGDRLPEPLRARIGQVVIGDGPGLGEKRVFSDLAITEILRRRKLIAHLKGYELVIPRRIVVENRGYVLSEKNVMEELTQAWQGQCNVCHFRFKSLVLPALPRELQGKSWRLKIADALPRGSFSVAVHFDDDAQLGQIFWVTGNVETQKRVPVATRALNLGERLTDSDITFELRDVTFASDSPATSEELIGQKVRQGLRAGDIVWRQTLLREPALRRGDAVKVSVGEGMVEVSMMAISEQDGFVGDRIRLKNRENQKAIFGKITGPGEVRIE